MREAFKWSAPVTVLNWEPPRHAYTKEGVKIPLADLPPGNVAKLCADWLEQVCGSAGVAFDFKVKGQK